MPAVLELLKTLGSGSRQMRVWRFPLALDDVGSTQVVCNETWAPTGAHAQPYQATLRVFGPGRLQAEVAASFSLEKRRRFQRYEHPELYELIDHPKRLY